MSAATATTAGNLPALPSSLTPEGNLSRYLQEIRKFPLLEPQEEFMLAKRWREHGDLRSRPPAGDQPSAARGQDRHGLSRLWPAGGRADLRGQCRHDAGGEALRSGPRLPPGDLRHVVDPRRDPGIHPAQLVAGEDGHHRGAEEAVLQPAQAEGPDAGDRGGRPVARAGHQDRHPPRRARGGGGQHEPPPRRARFLAQRPGQGRGRHGVAGLAGRRQRPTRRPSSARARSSASASTCWPPR